MPGQCRFQSAWLDDPQFKEWLQRDDQSSLFARCIVCKKPVTLKDQGVARLKEHAKGKKHVKGMFYYDGSLFLLLKIVCVFFLK